MGDTDLANEPWGRYWLKVVGWLLTMVRKGGWMVNCGDRGDSQGLNTQESPTMIRMFSKKISTWMGRIPFNLCFPREWKVSNLLSLAFFDPGPHRTHHGALNTSFRAFGDGGDLVNVILLAHLSSNIVGPFSIHHKKWHLVKITVIIHYLIIQYLLSDHDPIW